MILDNNITGKDKAQIAVFDYEGVAEYLDDKFTFISGVVRNNDGIVIMGLGRVVNEFKIVINPKYTSYQIAKALKILFESAHNWAKHSGSNETIVIITKGGEYYKNVLIKHFGFDEINGVPLKLGD